MVLVVWPEEHTGLLSFAEAIEVVENAFRMWGEETSLNLPRQIVNQSIAGGKSQAKTGQHYLIDGAFPSGITF